MQSVFAILPHIGLHTFIHRRRCQPRKATNHRQAVGVRWCLAQGWPILPPEPPFTAIWATCRQRGGTVHSSWSSPLMMRSEVKCLDRGCLQVGWGIKPSWPSRWLQDSRRLFVTYRICSEMKSGDAQRNVQKNTEYNLKYRDQNHNIYNIYSKKKQHSKY